MDAAQCAADKRMMTLWGIGDHQAHDPTNGAPVPAEAPVLDGAPRFDFVVRFTKQGRGAAIEVTSPEDGDGDAAEAGRFLLAVGRAAGAKKPVVFGYALLFQDEDGEAFGGGAVLVDFRAGRVELLDATQMLRDVTEGGVAEAQDVTLPPRTIAT